MFCVCVTFDIAPDHHDRFVDRVRIQAVDSRNEPGCHRFDVWTEHGQPGGVFLYETYDDRAAFDAHLASDHFLAFDAEVAPYVLKKSLVTWDTPI